jgi:hypothetical protein
VPKFVGVSCEHCGNSNTTVDDSRAIPEVPATYESTAANDHRQSTNHFFNRRAIIGNHPAGHLRDNITAKISEFTHGKEHNG